MNRNDLQRLARLRVSEAKSLLDNNHFPGAYYLLGFSIECAFKACIAKQFRRHDFPDLRLVRDSYSHNLERLLQLSGLGLDFKTARRDNPSLELNWSIVKDWSVESRYEWSVSERTVRDFYQAVNTRTNGVLPWLRARW